MNVGNYQAEGGGKQSGATSDHSPFRHAATFQKVLTEIQDERMDLHPILLLLQIHSQQQIKMVHFQKNNQYHNSVLLLQLVQLIMTVIIIKKHGKQLSVQQHLHPIHHSVYDEQRDQHQKLLLLNR